MVSYQYLYSPLFLEYHSRSQFHTVNSSFWFVFSYPCDAQRPKQSEGSFVPAEEGQTSSGESGGNSAAVDQVFSMFKDFFEKKLEEKENQIEQRSKLDKEVVQLKFKGNQKKFELNVELDAIFEIESESIEPNLSQIKKTFRRRQATYSKATEADKNR